MKAARKQREVTSDASTRILKAAETLFAERGYDGASVNLIAKRAGVSKANVFHHFATKNDLYLAVLREACSHGAHLVQTLDEPAPLAERVAGYAQDHLSHILAHEHISRLVARELLKNRPRRAEELATQIFGDNFSRLVEALGRAQAQSELRADLDPAMVACVLIAANVFFFEARAVLRHLPGVDFADDPARYGAMLADIVLNGVERKQ